MEIGKEVQGGQRSEASVARESQEVQAAMIMAKKFPRDIKSATDRILEDCKQKSLAEVAAYSYPQGGGKVEGPSIRLAETLVRSWGNMDCGVVELKRTPGIGNIPGESVMMAYCWDLETNTRTKREFTVKHWRDRTDGGRPLRDDREIYEAVANQGSRRLRACIISMIPSYVVDKAIDQCDQTLKGDGSEPLADRIAKMIAYFQSAFQVTKAAIEKRLGHKADAITESELVGLKKIANSLRDGFASKEDFFEAAQADSQPTAEKRTIKNFAPGSDAPPKKPELPDCTPDPEDKVDPVAKPDPDKKLELSQTVVKIIMELNLGKVGLTDWVRKVTGKTQLNKLDQKELETLVLELTKEKIEMEKNAAK